MLIGSTETNFMNDIILRQHLDNLDKRGYFEMHAKPPHVEMVMANLRLVRPDVQMVERFKDHCCGQVVFLPKLRTKILAWLECDLANFEAGARKTRDILAAFPSNTTCSQPGEKPSP